MFLKLKNFLSINTGILIRLDDIAENMNWNLMEKSEFLFEKYGIKPVLGVIPNNKDVELLSNPKVNDFWERVRGWKKKGWEIAMHGYTHEYVKESNNKDYFNHGGKSEFFGQTLETQKEKIRKGLEKFKDENIIIRTFYAPNHSYDQNTFLALKSFGIDQVIDGYGIMPYSEHGIKFIPQLFYKVFALPFGIQSTQIHLNYWNNKDFDNFEKFIIKNSNKIITYDHALKKVNNNLLYKLIKIFTKKMLKFKRFINN